MREFFLKNLQIILSFIIITLIIALITIFLLDIQIPHKTTISNNEIALNNPNDETTLPVAQEPTEEVSQEETKYFIDIKGAVKNPGVYEVTKGTIINDIIKLAGGLKSNASTKYLNLSKQVTNEMVIYIYTTTEEKNLGEKAISECTTSNANIKECEGSSTITTNQAAPNNQNTTNSASANQSNPQAKININTATEEELTTLNGIGSSKAKAIITYRQNNGPFKKIEDIQNVSGIGSSVYQQIKDYITI